MDGPNISSYRGLNIINTRSFSLEDGAPPRDVLCRRVRVAEYHRIPWEPENSKRSFSFYDESKDSWQKFTFRQLYVMASLDDGENRSGDTDADFHLAMNTEMPEIVIVRPNIEHNMLGIIMGRGGIEDLGATLWGQTELSVYDDSMHGIWGMSYKYNERAIVFNQKNLIRLWDVAYDGYNGGKDTMHLKWDKGDAIEDFKNHTFNVTKSYEGVSMMVMRFPKVAGADTGSCWPSPIVFHDNSHDMEGGGEGNVPVDGEHIYSINKTPFRVFHTDAYTADYNGTPRYTAYHKNMPDFTRCHNNKNAGTSSEENETNCNTLAFQGTHRVHDHVNVTHMAEVTGNGHHGQDFVGVASIRAGKGVRMTPSGSMAMIHQI
jgi:hypothetical protein